MKARRTRRGWLRFILIAVAFFLVSITIKHVVVVISVHRIVGRAEDRASFAIVPEPLRVLEPADPPGSHRHMLGYAEFWSDQESVRFTATGKDRTAIRAEVGELRLLFMPPKEGLDDSRRSAAEMRAMLSRSPWHPIAAYVDGRSRDHHETITSSVELDAIVLESTALSWRDLWIPTGRLKAYDLLLKGILVSNDLQRIIRFRSPTTHGLLYVRECGSEIDLAANDGGVAQTIVVRPNGETADPVDTLLRIVASYRFLIERPLPPEELTHLVAEAGIAASDEADAPAAVIDDPPARP